MLVCAAKGCLAPHNETIDTPIRPLLRRRYRWPHAAPIRMKSPHTLIKHLV